MGVSSSRILQDQFNIVCTQDIQNFDAFMLGQHNSRKYRLPENITKDIVCHIIDHYPNLLIGDPIIEDFLYHNPELCSRIFNIIKIRNFRWAIIFEKEDNNVIKLLNNAYEYINHLEAWKVDRIMNKIIRAAITSKNKIVLDWLIDTDIIRDNRVQWNINLAEVIHLGYNRLLPTLFGLKFSYVRSCVVSLLNEKPPNLKIVKSILNKYYVPGKVDWNYHSRDHIRIILQLLEFQFASDVFPTVAYDHELCSWIYLNRIKTKPFIVNLEHMCTDAFVDPNVRLLVFYEIQYQGDPDYKITSYMATRMLIQICNFYKGATDMWEEILSKHIKTVLAYKSVIFNINSVININKFPHVLWYFCKDLTMREALQESDPKDTLYMFNLKSSRNPDVWKRTMHKLIRFVE